MATSLPRAGATIIRLARESLHVRGADRVLLVAAGLLVVAGPWMSVQEFSHASQDDSYEALTGSPARFDASFREPWRTFLLVEVVVVGVLGTFAALRVARQPRVRAVSGRLLALLLVGLTLLDLAFLADGRWFLQASHEARGASIVWLYPIAGILVGGSVVRLAQLEEAFAPRAPPLARA